MKVLAAILMFITIGVIAHAQTPPAAPVISDLKVTGGIELIQNKGVKNSPFSADAVSESVQTLADGNRIVRSSTSKLYRNSEGRFRQEFASGTGGFFGNAFAIGEGITVINPGQSKFYLDSHARIARVYDELASANVAIATAPLAAVSAVDAVKAIDMSELTPEARVEIERATAELQKVKANKEQYKAAADEFKRATEQMRATVVTAAPAISAIGFPSKNSKWETRTEDLGEQNYEGVSAHGTRTITTIPAGEIGNERPIEIVYEKWFSNELQMVVYSRQSDPRTGEQTYKLTNINRNEPDPSLFQVPNGYKVVSGGQGMTYTVNGSGQGGSYVKSSTGQGATYVKGTAAQSGTRTKNQN